MSHVFKTLYQHGSRPRHIWVICPFAGGSLSAFKSWMSLDQKILPEESLILLATYPGRDHRMRECPLASIAELANEMTDALMTWLTQTPLSIDARIQLCGHSMGAQVAYEVCQRFETYYGAQNPIQTLIVSGCHAPHIESRRKLSHLNNDDFIDELIAIGSGSPVLKQHPELLPMFMPMLRADFLATENYYYPVRPSEGRLKHTSCVLVYGESDPEAWKSEVMAWHTWLTSQHSEIRTISISGDHFYITANPELFLKRISEQINKKIQTPISTFAIKPCITNVSGDHHG